MDAGMKQRLLRHLDSCVAELDLDLGSRPDSGLGSSPGSVNDTREPNGRGPLGPQSPVPLIATHPANGPPPQLIKAELPDLEMSTRPDSSTTAGDENNNSSRPTSAFGPINIVNPAQLMDPQHQQALASTSANPQNGTDNQSMLSVVQVVPSRLPDGQVVFLLPSHYCQLAAAAAANGISIGPSAPQAIWAATNMSLLKTTDKMPLKRPLEETIDLNVNNNWPPQLDATSTTNQQKISSGKSPRPVELHPVAEQPLDFTTPKKMKLGLSSHSVAMTLDGLNNNSQHPTTTSTMQPPHNTQMTSRTQSPLAQPSQPIKDEEGMWRPW